MILRIVISFAALSTLFKQHKIYVTLMRNTGLVSVNKILEKPYERTNEV
ncbi:hypothetical protein GO685_02940 [Wolbachia endosymbiont of Madathamugadia hiepei]|nr:hypothetical protein [Wolbachia endosymbiont of Madathamugadia hiepei]NUX01457.1 hypothetical protein [Wolbachia endosymbiont of Madathamugadia hiepei]